MSERDWVQEDKLGGTAVVWSRADSSLGWVVLMEMRKVDKFKICLLSSLLLKMKLEYMYRDVRKKITLFRGLALFPIYLNNHVFQDNQISVLFIQIKDR